ncbi:MAG: tetratricopeptide repeat protein, partial [Deltaproteobacteria bacterium]|nr:tetratricopeptide repeat protein [Deltaproteobacteria bacterium]
MTRIEENKEEHSSSPKENSGYDELLEHLRAVDGVNESVAEILARNWQRVLVAIGFVLLAVWLGGKYQERQVAKANEASNYFVAAQNDFSVFVDSLRETRNDAPKPVSDTADKDSAEKQSPYEEKFEAIKSSYSDSVYAKLVSLYTAKAKFLGNDVEKALENIAEFSDSQNASFAREGYSGKYRASSFLGEVSQLMRAKMLLTQAETRAEGREILLELARSSRVLSVEALVA